MNIKDAPQRQVPEVGKLEEIFLRQNELHKKYTDIETKNGTGKAILQGQEFNIDDARSQALIKDFLWRIAEELCEALEAFEQGDNLHTIEELSDALHFFVEMVIIMEMGPGNLLPAKYLRDKKSDLLEEIYALAPLFSSFAYGFKQTILALGLIGNCLKNKPWKSTQMLTDQYKVEMLMQTSFQNLLGMFFAVGCGPEEIYRVYFQKSEVNKFRIRSNY